MRAIADYSRRLAADLVVVTNKARRSRGYWLAGSFAAALGKAVTVPTIVLPYGRPLSIAPGSPFRYIVSAIDFSEASFLGLAEALNLAQRSGGRLKLLHVLSTLPAETVYGGSQALRLGRAYRARARRIDRELQSLIPPAALDWSEIDAATVPGRADDAILAHASSEGADLIVVGLPRRARLEEFVVGSTVRRVLRRATSPVLLVPGPPTPPRLRPGDERELALGFYQAAFGVGAANGREARASWL